MSKNCVICGRDNVKLTKHHLVPKENSDTVLMCNPCHKQIHVVFTHHELKHEFDSIEKIKESDRMESFINWIQGTGKEDIKVKESKRVRKWRH